MKITKKQHQGAVQRIMNGESYEKVAADLGITVVTVTRWCNREGIRMKNTFSEEDRQRAVNRIQNGESRDAVAAEIGASVDTLA